MASDFVPNEPFDHVFLLKSIDERRTRTGKPYLALVLGTSEGAWDGRVWDMAMSSLPGLAEGAPVRARGTAQLYQEKIQLIIEDISKIEERIDPRSVYPASEASEKELRGDFASLIKGVRDPALKTLMETMLADKAISNSFFVAPAAITMHHARIGGLAEHSINVCRLAHGTAAAAPWLDGDLLTAGALLHDIGKVLEYEAAGDFRATVEGKFLGHIIQGHSLVEGWIRAIPDFPRETALQILHILLSHHGQLEYGSPKTPATAEALVIHFADDLDAKLDMIKEAGKAPETEEAFVRGLRRTFLYRDEQRKVEGGKVKGEHTDHGAGEKDAKTADQVKPGSGKKTGGQEELF